MSCSITASTGAPAFTMIITFLGRSSPSTKSSSDFAPTSFLPGLAPTNSSVVEVVRLYTET